MAQVTIPFDGKPLPFEVPEANLIEVLSPRESGAIADLDGEIKRALENPIGQEALEDWVKPTDSVLLISDDNTRLTPSDRIIPPLLDRLNAAGVPDEQILCVIALGTHRYMTEAELRDKVGEAVYRRIRVINHEWKDPDQLVDLGVSEHGTPLVVNKAAIDADVIIGIGAVVPHHIPGFSGSSKIIQPGICGFDTTAETHLLSCSERDSLLGILDNPVRRDLDSMADRVGMKTIFNVVMNSDGGVVGAFYGEMRAAFLQAVELASDIYGIPYHETPDIVIANSCPCDLDFWQSHKSQYPAQRMVKPGGTIIVCTPAPEGISPVHTDLLEYTSWPAEEIKAGYRNGTIKDGVATALAMAWALVREKANVITYSPGIPADHKEKLGHTHAPTIEWALEEAFRRQGPDARVTVLTHAADMLPVKDFLIGPMVEIAVIADDLTGAADTGIQFRPVYADTLLMAAAALADEGAAAHADVLSIHTASRALAADEARDRVAETARRLINLSPHRVYKKVDSCLRGNAGAETEALVETLGLEMSFVAPAFPQMGRTTEDDIHRVHGVPVAESEMGRDPATPVLDNRLTTIIAGQARLPVGHVGLQAIAAGVDATVAEVKRLKESGVRHICFDATEQAHLETIAALTLDRFPKTLLVGSAGLGLALRSVLDLPPAPEDDVRAGLPDGHHLLAFGTASQRARAQIAAMRAAYPMVLREVAAADLLAGGGPITERLLDDLTGLSLEGDLVLCISPPDTPPDTQVAARLADVYGKLVAALIVRTRPVTTFLSGGDTAISVLQRLGAKGLKLAREISPTMACGRAVGGVADGFIFGTKPGAMGNDDAMTEWRRFWEE